MPSRRIAEIGSLSETERRLLRGLYSSGPSAYGSVSSLVLASGLSKKKVLQFLHGNNAYTQYHIANRTFPRLRVISTAINEIWCMDLAQMDKLSSDNDGVRHLLVCVDVLSRFIRVETMRNKAAITAKDALMKMIGKGSEMPKKIWVDEGTEFAGAFKVFCSSMGIVRYNTKTVIKAAYAERAIRSLKNIIYRYMEDLRTDRYIHKLQSFVKVMNSRENRSIGMAPKNVTNRDAIRIINSIPIGDYKPSFRVGDYVRAAIKDKPFRKGYKPQFSREIYLVTEIVTRNPVTYRITDKDKKILPNRFYERELIHYAI